MNKFSLKGPIDDEVAKEIILKCMEKYEDVEASKERDLALEENIWNIRGNECP